MPTSFSNNKSSYISSLSHLSKPQDCQDSKAKQRLIDNFVITTQAYQASISPELFPMTYSSRDSDLIPFFTRNIMLPMEARSLFDDCSDIAFSLSSMRDKSYSITFSYVFNGKSELSKIINFKTKKELNDKLVQEFTTNLTPGIIKSIEKISISEISIPRHWFETVLDSLKKLTQRGAKFKLLLPRGFNLTAEEKAKGKQVFTTGISRFAIRTREIISKRKGLIIAGVLVGGFGLAFVSGIFPGLFFLAGGLVMGSNMDRVRARHARVASSTREEIPNYTSMKEADAHQIGCKASRGWLPYARSYLSLTSIVHPNAYDNGMVQGSQELAEDKRRAETPKAYSLSS